MRAKQFACILVILLFFLGAALPGTTLAAEKIKIGILGPFSGSLAFNASEMKKGMLLALDKINQEGGLFGQEIELVFGDTECKPDKGLAA
jgi:branched-chain amino acid transport system substrate-binding protein